MSLGMPEGPSVRQWELHVRRMIRMGDQLEPIIYAMSAAGWPYDDAIALVKKTAGSERWRAAWMMIGGAAAAAVFGLLAFITITSPNGGYVVWGPGVCGIASFVYGLIRLTKIKV